MRFDPRLILACVIIGLIGVACQAQGPLEPYVSGDRDVAILGDGPGEGEIPKPDPHKNLGDCIQRCAESHKQGLAKCIAGGADPDQCARKLASSLRNCHEKCRKQCQAECEEDRQNFFRSCVDAGKDPNKCAQEANRRADKCKSGCRRPIKK